MKPLIVTADDYALSEAVDDGILDLVEQGRLSATSCMTCSPRWPEAAARLTPAVQARIRLGLHLDLTAFAPGARTLKDVIVRSLLRQLDATHLQQVVVNQLDRFEQALGRAPDYVDGHQHVHQLPQVREALLAELRRRYPTAPRPWLRISDASTGQGWKGHVIAALGSRALRRQARAAGFQTTGRLLGVYAFDGDAAAYLQRLSGWLPLMQPGDALMCHPAARLDAGEEIGVARFQEHAVLGGDAFAALLARCQCRVVHGAAWRDAEKGWMA